MLRVPRKRTLKRLAVLVLVILALGLAAASILSYSLAGDRDAAIRVETTSHRDSSATLARDSLRLATVNLAHGRKDGVHQALEKTATIRSNLDVSARVLARALPDVVALQEADGPSFWSGGFSHVEHLAEASLFTHFARAEHVGGLGLSYGTALLSRRPLEDARSVTFAPAPPSPAKGFVAARVRWPLSAEREIVLDVVSVHLDFTRASVRLRQVGELIAHLSPRTRPLIVMGDFNCSWTDPEPTLRTLARELELKAYRPQAEDLVTFPSSGRRLDWILISEELEFRSSEVLPDVVSDHRVVTAVVVPAQGGG